MPVDRKALPQATDRELPILLQVSQILDSSLDLRTVVEPVLEAITASLGLTFATLTLLNRSTGEISIESAWGLSASQKSRGRYRLGEGVTGRVIETGRPAIVPRVSEEPRFLDRTRVREAAAGRDMSFVCVPIKLGREVAGALSAHRPATDPATLQEDARILSVVASLIAQAVRLRQSAQEEREKLVEENQRLQEELKDRFRPSNIIGNSTAMQEVYRLISQVSASDTTVLLRGESGTGKELVAHAIHYSSPRAKKPFVKVSSAALPESLVESELFGYEPGAFTDARSQKKGRFELAQGGTIFLDEIGELTGATQVKLLRVLQEREIERLGGVQPIKVNVRVIAATNKDLEAAVKEGSFREDLYYRLNVYSIYMPPLRERKTDIPLLADHFVEKHAAAHGKDVRRIATSAIDMLMSYHWPGNVRELENCVERAVLVCEGGAIHAHHLPPTLQTAEVSGTLARQSLKEALDAYEKDLVQDALKSARGNRAKAARLLHTTERILGYAVRKHGIDTERFR